MGRIKERRMGLRRRWLWNTAAVVASVGLVCALAVTVLFALSYRWVRRKEAYKDA